MREGNSGKIDLRGINLEDRVGTGVLEKMTLGGE